MAVKQKVVECVAPTTAEAQLQVILRELQDITSLGSQDQQLCAKIVINLGNIDVPNDPINYKQFVAVVEKVQECLVKECIKADLIYVTLKTFFQEISTSENKHFSPAMSIVLQLIKRSDIPDCVKTVFGLLHTEERLKRAMMVLCNWLKKWTYTENLGPLILASLQELERQHHPNLLEDIINAMIENYFKLLIAPTHRQNVGPIVLYMLNFTEYRGNIVAFTQVIRHVNNVCTCLYREQSESSLFYLHKIVEKCVILMEHFPKYNNSYVALKNDLEPYLKLGHPFSGPQLGSSPASPISSVGRVGLNNLGNTCYMNSVLQALYMTKPFRNKVLLNSKKKTSLLAKLQELFALLQFSNRPSLSPHDISTLARKPGFTPGHQHDSSEFLGHLLDVLHEQENAMSVAESVGQQPEAASLPSDGTTVVQEVFGGRTVTISRCIQCITASDRLDNFRELQLAFPSDSSDNQSVQTLLNYYLEPEQLRDDNKYYCDVCDSLVDGERTTHVQEPPPRLVLTLKHFRYDPASQQRAKLLQYVQLDQRIRLEHTEYELYAAVVHCGSSVDSGHYYTYAKDETMWWKLNDCTVTRTTPQELCNLKPPETPYILFYSRVDATDPAELSEALLPADLRLLVQQDRRNNENERRKQVVRTYSTRRNNEDDEEPPPAPPGCGGGPGFSSNSSNMYVC